MTELKDLVISKELAERLKGLGLPQMESIAYWNADGRLKLRKYAVASETYSAAPHAGELGLLLPIKIQTACAVEYPLQMAVRDYRMPGKRYFICYSTLVRVPEADYGVDIAWLKGKDESEALFNHANEAEVRGLALAWLIENGCYSFNKEILDEQR